MSPTTDPAPSPVRNPSIPSSRSPDGRRPAGRRGRRWTVAALRLGWFAVGTQMFMVVGLIGALAPTFGVSVGVAGTAVTAFSLASAVGGPLLNARLAPVPPRRTLLASLGVVGLAALLGAAAPTIGVLVATQVLGGLAASVWGPVSAATAVAAAGPDRVGRTLGGFQAAGSLAMITGAPIGLVLAGATSWRLAFGLTAAMCGIAVAILAGTGHRSGTPSPAPAAASFRVMRTPTVLAILGATLLVMAVSNSAFSYLGVLLAGRAGPVGVELGLMLFGLAGLVGVWAGGRAADRWGGRAVAGVTAAVLLGVVALLPALITVTPAVVALLLFWGLAGWAFVPGQQHRLITANPRAAAVLLAGHGSAVQLGFAAGALAGGLVIDAAGASRLWLVPLTASAPAMIGCLYRPRSRP